jgi:hypothetical protein
MAEDFTRGAEEMEAAFARASESIGKGLARSALDGEAAFKRMTANVLADLARIALDQILPQPSAGKSNGGVALDALSGLFAGSTTRSGGVTINMQVHGAPAADLLRSKGQVAQSLAQAVSDGMRRI